MTFVGVVFVQTGDDVNGKTPLRGATVRLWNPRGKAEGTTGDRGCVRLHVSAVGDYEASAVKDGYAVHKVLVAVRESGKNQATFVLKPLPSASSRMASLSIRVVDASSRKPIPGAAVLILAGSKSYGRGLSTCSEGDLRQTLPRGTYDLVVKNRGYQPHRETVSLIKGNVGITVMLARSDSDGRGNPDKKRDPSFDRNTKANKNQNESNGRKTPADGKLKPDEQVKPAKDRKPSRDRDPPAKEDKRPNKISKPSSDKRGTAPTAPSPKQIRRIRRRVRQTEKIHQTSRTLRFVSWCILHSGDRRGRCAEDRHQTQPLLQLSSGIRASCRRVSGRSGAARPLLAAGSGVRGQAFPLDEQGKLTGVVAGASIELKNQAGQVAGRATSDAQGSYKIDIAPRRLFVQGPGRRVPR